MILVRWRRKYFLPTKKQIYKVSQATKKKKKEGHKYSYKIFHDHLNPHLPHLEREREREGGRWGMSRWRRKRCRWSEGSKFSQNLWFLISIILSGRSTGTFLLYILFGYLQNSLEYPNFQSFYTQILCQFFAEPRKISACKLFSEVELKTTFFVYEKYRSFYCFDWRH